MYREIESETIELESGEQAIEVLSLTEVGVVGWALLQMAKLGFRFGADFWLDDRVEEDKAHTISNRDFMATITGDSNRPDQLCLINFESGLFSRLRRGGRRMVREEGKRIFRT